MLPKKVRFSLFILLVLLAPTLAVVSGCAQKESPTGTTKTETAAPAPTLTRPDVVTSATEAKELLVAGNERFVKGELAKKDLGDTRRQKLLTEGQKPFVAIVSCSDSRVPPELIFDQGLGDLFVIRVAGNILDKVGTGSVEYAVEHLHVPLVVVMGHEACGAVKATVEGGKPPTENIGAIVEKINPSVEKAKTAGATDKELVEKSTKENVKAMLAELEKSPIIKEAAEHGKVTILGAYYHVGTGQVEWLEEAKH
uniref:Carbonic anhydrase n=1 Tax=Ammonifex degensii TaxID=42838 RepID=A0A7C2EIQ3_9THEO